MTSLLLRFFPARWRARYGDEFEALLAERPIGPFDVADVLLAAIDAHLHRHGLSAVPRPDRRIHHGPSHRGVRRHRRRRPLVLRTWHTRRAGAAAGSDADRADGPADPARGERIADRRAGRPQRLPGATLSAPDVGGVRAADGWRGASRSSACWPARSSATARSSAASAGGSSGCSGSSPSWSDRPSSPA